MKPVLILLVLLALAYVVKRQTLGFAAQHPRDYAGTTPVFDLRTHLNGPILSEGMIYGPTGRVASRFTAKMHGSWNGATGTLTEDFTYSTGTTQAREWTLTPGEEGRFTATAPDVIGTGTGQVSGATIRMHYRIRLPAESGGHVLSVTDWLYLTENGVIMNRSQMRKFGIKVAELVATLRPAP
ncbi:Protein of unknown function [Salinihabitans flavidus]|uniref:DUF3833 domain-containing protein n=1 Tax=Salinihabitans flavidus TaxID=569882 RepID=A0A1H8MPU0_9RHOB|nr:DUF3833 domain-containing protein [Salinihabitans flavidus]SEO19268.1 Protein of unknown function [Salinihabitans flavidus]